MGIAVGAALKKVAVAILAEPKVLKNLGMAVLVVVVAMILPSVFVVSLFTGGFQVDTAELLQYVEANLTAADVQLLRNVENTMSEIETAILTLPDSTLTLGEINRRIGELEEEMAVLLTYENALEIHGNRFSEIAEEMKQLKQEREVLLFL